MIRHDSANDSNDSHDSMFVAFKLSFIINKDSAAWVTLVGYTSNKCQLS